ncbi:MAG: hypothetical protein AABW90_03495 [Nanoarchaeota archaeon]
MKNGVKNKIINLKNIIIIIVILVALFILYIGFSSKKTSFSEEDKLVSGPIPAYDSEEFPDSLETVSGLYPAEPLTESQCTGNERRCSANGKTTCCYPGFNCVTDSSGNPKCENPCSNPRLPKICPNNEIVCCPQGFSCTIDSNGKKSCTGPCTNPVRPIFCATKDGPMCCDKGFCIIDSTGNLKCGDDQSNCPTGKPNNCGVSSTGAVGCCPKDQTCSMEKNGNWTCCGLGTYHSPELNRCIGAEEIICRAEDEEVYFCIGANLVCCLGGLDKKNCCNKEAECCFGSCCNTAVSFCDKATKSCVNY